MNEHKNEHKKERGQGLVEFTLMVPVVLLLVVSVAELGMIFGSTHTLGYGSREGARVGSALASGGVDDCDQGDDPSDVDGAVIAAVQRIIKSPGSGVDLGNVTEIRIFRATPTGGEFAGDANVWTYAGPGLGHVLDASAGVALDFRPPPANAWRACIRDNAGSDTDSLGVTVVYQYDFVTPFPSMLDALAGGALSLTLRETTVMALNPSI